MIGKIMAAVLARKHGLSQVLGYPVWYNIVYDGDKSVYTYQLRADLDAGDLIIK